MAGAGDGLAGQVIPDFPILARRVHGKRLVYLDSAASSQKPASVIDAMDDYYRCHHANIHRGAHTLGDEATALYDGARVRIARFVNAPDPDCVIFAKNVTEALNLVAYAWGWQNLRPGDRIVLSGLEHHANIVPWFTIAQRTGAIVEWIPVTDEGEIDMEAAGVLIDGASVVGCTATSNVTGAMPDIRTICAMARATGALSVVDAAQLAPHLPLDVQAIGADFVGFTGHKMLGPTGIGVLWGRREILDSMPVFLGGGEMIQEVTFEGFGPAPLPAKYEAGTMPIAEAVGLAAAVDYLEGVGMERIRAHEVELLTYALVSLEDTFGDKLRILGPRDVSRRSGIVTFTFGDIHPHDLATILDGEGVAIRAGHHCAKPLHKSFGLTASARASFYLYNTREDVDALVHGLDVAAELFGL